MDKALYRKARKAGYNAKDAGRIARIVPAFRKAEDDGLVRIRVEEDSDVDTSWMDDEQRAEWNGEAWGTIAEVMDDATGEWEQVDSCWGHIGYADPSDPIENVYVVDEMDAALDELEARSERAQYAVGASD